MNTIGQMFRVTSFGESHGSHVGCVIDGCPAGLLLDLDQMQTQVNRRKSNQSAFATTRHEEDQLEMMSGLVESTTTGAPICILIKNKDVKSADYDLLKDVYRPNHADYTYAAKYGIRDHRGGGRSSVRVTAPLVAAGDIAYQLLRHQTAIQTTAYVSQIGTVALPNRNAYTHLDLLDIDANELRCPDEQVARQMKAHIDAVQAEGDTLGGVITCVIKNVPVGLGEPIFSKLHAQLGHAMLSINSVKGFEYGYGFASCAMKGSEYNDAFVMKDGKVHTHTNFSGGIQGGISNGNDIFFHVAFKPISSIRKTQQTIDTKGQEVSLHIEGRHDVCAVPRAVPIVEAYANIILADAILQAKQSTL